MFSSLKQSVAIGLLCILAWSCSGLSFGMLGHGLMQMGTMDGEQHDMATMHECCGVTTEDAGAANTAAMDHHTPTVATLSFVDLLIALVVVAYVAILKTPKVINVFAKWQLYARRWSERLSYFALHLTQLFSRGILHPKTW